ncbi:MAG: hypothetical protein JWQ96_1711 [Segetibacter sp.]|nr:hypothetical protein [Segetibacter sp.]
MPINKNHEFEDLDGVKCSIVERNTAKERVGFMKSLLEYNGYEVIVVASSQPKVAPAPKPVAVVPASAPNGEASITQPESASSATTPLPAPVHPIPHATQTFTVGVTDVMFNAINAVFGRRLHTPDGHIVTLAYWEQKEALANDEVPYFENLK